jgi:hypothetical protein
MKITMIIMHLDFKDHVMTIVDPPCIPRVGERIDIWHRPSPEVKAIIYNEDMTEVQIGVQ